MLEILFKVPPGGAGTVVEVRVFQGEELIKTSALRL